MNKKYIIIISKETNIYSSSTSGRRSGVIPSGSYYSDELVEDSKIHLSDEGGKSLGYINYSDMESYSVLESLNEEEENHIKYDEEGLIIQDSSEEDKSSSDIKVGSKVACLARYDINGVKLPEWVQYTKFTVVSIDDTDAVITSEYASIDYIVNINKLILINE